MKTPIITLAALLMLACGTQSIVSSTDVANAPDQIGGASLSTDAQPASMPDYFEYDFDNDGIIDKAEKKESVIGDFNGDGKSEHAVIYYYSKPIPGLESHQYDGDYYHYCEIHFSDEALTDISLVYIGCNLVNEGDLNGDGSDELGFFNVGGFTMWGNYSVLTFIDGTWHELVCIRHNENWNPAPYQDLVRKDSYNYGHVIVKDIRCDDGEIFDKSVKIDDALLPDVSYDVEQPTVEEIDEELATLR